MSESAQTLRQKVDELEAAVSQAQQELARADTTRRTEAHHGLAEALRTAREWLQQCRSVDDGDEAEATAAARRAEGLMHDIRMRRNDI